MTPSSTPEPELGTQPATTDAPGSGEPTAAEVTPPDGPDAPSGATKVTATEPAEVEPAEVEPAEVEPVAADTVVETEPVAAEPVAAGAVTAEPVTAEPVTAEPVAAEAVTKEPAGQEPVAAEPVVVTGTPFPAGAPGGEASAPDADGIDEDEDDYEVLGDEPADRYPTIVPLIGALLGLTAIAALILIAFGLPAVKSAPHRLPIGVSGSAEINTQLRTLFSANGATTFKVTSFTKEADLRTAIEDHEVYGGLSVTETGVTMLVSSAASPVAADTLSSVANSLSAQAGNQIPVTDIVAMPTKDPRGEGLAAANLPIVIAAVLPALLLIPLYRRRLGAQLGVTVGAAVVIALGLSAVLNYVLGSTYSSNFLLVTVGLAAGVLATSLLLLGLFAVAGRVGVGVGAALLVLFAAPLSGLATAPEWLPTPWGSIGQLLPAGANATLLRSTAYFDGKGSGQALLVLGVWALIGLALIGLGLITGRTADPVDPVAELPEREPVTI